MIVLSQNGSSSLCMFPVIRFRERDCCSVTFWLIRFAGHPSLSRKSWRVVGRGEPFLGENQSRRPVSRNYLGDRRHCATFLKPPAHRIENAHDVSSTYWTHIIIIIIMWRKKERRKKYKFWIAPRVSYYYLFGCVLYQRKRWRIKSISLVQFVKCFVSPLGYLLTNTITCTASTKQQSSAV